MAINFTPEQQKVIELHEKNILVSAAAGSGKTAVLVERIIQMVCNEEKPVDIDRLLIVTFTNAAAAEMRERIAAGIANKLIEHPESEHIQKQSTLLHNAQITTIDSFSLFLIRNHFHETPLDPAFRVADEGEMKLMSQDVLSGLLEDAFSGEISTELEMLNGEGEVFSVEQFHDFVEYFCPNGKETVLEKHILNLSRYAASFPWPDEWLRGRKKDYEAINEEQIIASDYGQYLKEHIAKILVGCVEKLRSAKRLAESPDGPYMYGELLDAEIEQLEKVCEKENLVEYAECIPTINFGRLPTKKDDSVSSVKRELAKELRNQVKKSLQEISEKFFATPLDLVAKQGRECAGPISVLIDLVLLFDKRMKEKKLEKKMIDFSDMEHYALEILWNKNPETGEITPSPIALEYRDYFEEILIDEYQDSNLVQEYLLMAVSGEECGHFNRFMVGDVKQSIYKFRLARPELFLEKYDSYADDGECQRIDLSKNFRSRSQVIETVNDIFEKIMSRLVGGIDYDEKAALYVGAEYPQNDGCESELLLVSGNTHETEALAIAQKIKELHGAFCVTDKATGTLRPATYKDMTILLRTTSGWDEEFKRVLEKEGIPVHITSKTGYFAATEVQELLQFLRVLDNPTQDIPLFGVIKSVFGGFTEEEIARIRAKEKNGSLYAALQNTVAEKEAANAEELNAEEASEEATREKCACLLEKINTYRAATVYLPIRELLQRIADDHYYLDYVTALPAGNKRRANVEMLFTKASDFEKTSYFGLFHFVRYMEQLEKFDVDYGEADTLDENADVVRIMSIHKSKGLEFPVVFVAGLSKRFNMQDVNQSLIVDMDLGIACDYVNPQKRIRNKTLRRTILSQKMKEDILAEELRVLYVALTRAKEKLIMTGAMSKAEEKWELIKEQQNDRLSFLGFIEANSYLDFLLPVITKCKVNVSVVQMQNILGEAFREQLGFAEKEECLLKAEEYADEELVKQLKERFAFVYPHKNLEQLYTKTTVSELKIAAMAQKDEAAYHAFEEKEVEPYIPAFKQEQEKVSGTVRGNAYHRVMEILDFEQVLERQFSEFPMDYASYKNRLDEKKLYVDLKDFLVHVTEELRLSEEYRNALSVKKLVHFFEQEIAYRMWAAERRGELYREQPFVLGIDATRVLPQAPTEETVLIQGIIDVFFVEDGEIVLLDYKTDIISSMQDLWDRYREQLIYYEEALSKLMDLPVKERKLYSFYLEQEG